MPNIQPVQSGKNPCPAHPGIVLSRILYIKKFGVPPPNSRIFIRVWQEVDGWECRAQMRQANALVPARADGKKG